MRELRQRLTSAEIAEWIAFNEIEPIGDLRGDFRIALLCALVANALRSKGRKFKPDDFMPFLNPAPRIQTAEEMQAKLKAFCNLHNKRFTKQRE